MDRIHVAVRVRPLNAREQSAGSAWEYTETTISQKAGAAVFAFGTHFDYSIL